MQLKLNEVQTKKNQENIGFMVIMVSAMAVWGGSWTSGKLVAGMAAPEVLAFWRFLITFISFIPMVFWFREKLAISFKTLTLIILSAIFLAVYNSLFFAGLRYGLAGAGGVLVTSLTPMFTFILAVPFFGRKVGRREILGLALGLIGGFIILDPGHIHLGELAKSGNLLFLLAALLWSALSVASQKAQSQGISTIVYSFYLYGFASVVDFFLALRFGVFEALHAAPFFWGNIFYLALFATTFATSIFFVGSKKLGADRASVFMYLVPVFAVLVSWLLLREVPQVSTLVGGALAMVAVYLVNKKS